MRRSLLRPVVVGAAVAVTAGLVAYLPTTAASAAAAAPSTPLYLHSASGGYAFDYALDPTVGTAPSGSTLSTSAPTSDAAATATTYGVGLRGSATLPLFSIPVTGSVTSACVDIWAAPDGSGNLLGTTTLAVALVRPGLTAVDLDPVEATYDGTISRVSGVVPVPDGTELPAGSSLQVAGNYSDDPTDIYYDAVDMPSSVTFNPTTCAGQPVGTGGSPSPSPSPSPGSGGGGTTGGPTYAISTPPSSFGQAAGEPSIGFSAPTSTAWFQGGFDTMSVRVPDSGEPTWGLATGQLSSQLISLDSIGAVDRPTGRIFDSQLVGACSLTEFSDNGTTWQQSQGCGLPHGEDHQTIGSGPFGSGALLPHTFASAVWYCSQANVTALCALSRDGGLTFGEGAPIYTSLNCGGIHGHVKVGPDGTAYVPNGACGGKVGIAYTKDADNLSPWPAPLIVPDSTVKPDGNDPSVGIDTANRMYVGYQGADGHAYAATRGSDGTWTRSIDVGAPLGIKNIEFATATAGDAGRAAFAFLGSTTGGNDQDPAFPGVWHLYVATTTDSGATWTTVDATPTDPVQRGTICMAGTTCTGSTRNLLDFMDITYDQKGRVLVAFPDGCVDACVTGGANTYANRATLAYQTSGTTLLSAFDPPAVVGTTTTYTGATTARSGATLPVSATLVASDGSVPAGAQVRFTLGDASVTVPVDAAGRAAGELPAAAGEVTAAFLGATGYGPSTNRVPVTTYDVRLVPSAPATPVSGAASSVTVSAVRADTGAVDASWTGTPTLTGTDTHASGLSCAAAVAGRSTCSGVAFGDLGAQTLSAGAPGGYLSGSAPVTVQPTGLAFVSPPATVKSGTAVTYTTRPLAAAGALVDGYRAVQALSTNGKGDTVPAPQPCSGATCALTVTFGKGGGTRTVTVQDTSSPSRAVTTTTAVKG